MEIPETRYARAGDISLAWSARGRGPPELVFCSMWLSHVEAFWDWSPFGRLTRRLATLGRTILFDLPGNGLSDPVSLVELPGIEEWVDYVRVVLDAADCERAVLVASSMAGGLAIPFAATHPDRVSGLVLIGAFARMHRAYDLPFAIPEELKDRGIRWWLERWGTGRQLERTAPSVADDPHEVELMARTERYCASPGVARTYFEMVAEMDLRHVLPAVRVPTLVLHRTGDRWIRVEHGRYLADHIDSAQLVELEGESHLIFYGDLDRAIAEIRSFLRGLPETQPTDRVLATIMFTDIVDSTRLAADLGDERWREQLDRHDAIIREQLGRFRGREVKTVGDGFIATFDGAARAVRCAVAVRESVRPLGLQIRAGLHSGEIELRGEDIGGIAVNAAARVAALAEAGEVLASQTVKDLSIGAGLTFSARGQHTLKGVPGSWEIHTVDA
jgi:class 3 adenylate cyclase